MNDRSPRRLWWTLSIAGLVAAAIVVTSVFFACESDMTPAPGDEIEAVGLAPVAEALTEAPGAEPLRPAILEPEVPAPSGDPDADIGLRWSWDPPQLQVYRSTAVHFRLDTAPSDHSTASCAWNFGDGSPAEKGCTVSHTFHGGQADQIVTLTLTDGDWTWKSTRTVPLERLPVVHGLLDDVEEGLDGLPAPAAVGPTSFRFAVVADSAATGGVPSDVKTAVSELRKTIRPNLVVHAGGVVVRGGGEAAWDHARRDVMAPLSESDVPVAFAMSPADLAEGAEVRPPPLQMLDGRGFPERYTFTHKGAFFLVLSADEREGVDEDTIHWIREELSKARVYEARYVISYLPLHKFGDEHLGTLDKKFRLYELFLRARVTTLFTAGYRVYFKGRYGALPVVSVGAMAGPGAKLAGTDFAQPASFVVVDQVDGVPERVFAVEGPTFDRAFDDGLLPSTVEVYTR